MVIAEAFNKHPAGHVQLGTVYFADDGEARNLVQIAQCQTVSVDWPCALQFHERFRFGKIAP
jgi:hypothetical protein